MVSDNIAVSFFALLIFEVVIFVLLQIPSLYVIKGIIILDNDGNRILAKVNKYN